MTRSFGLWDGEDKFNASAVEREVAAAADDGNLERPNRQIAEESKQQRICCQIIFIIIM